jgi:hypothetical protein
MVSEFNGIMPSYRICPTNWKSLPCVTEECDSCWHGGEEAAMKAGEGKTTDKRIFNCEVEWLRNQPLEIRKLARDRWPDLRNDTLLPGSAAWNQCH